MRRTFSRAAASRNFSRLAANPPSRPTTDNSSQKAAGRQVGGSAAHFAERPTGNGFRKAAGQERGGSATRIMQLTTDN
jgi:hypothetical protein